MRQTGRRVRALALLGVLAAIAVSCASAPQKKDDQPWPESTRSDYEHADDPCKEKGGAPRQCQADQDCCEGYVCSLDPERSRVMRYCLEG